jgi:hypothetical protein
MHVLGVRSVDEDQGSFEASSNVMCMCLHVGLR